MILQDFLRAERGGVSILTAVSSVVLIGFAGLATDVGAVYLDARRLQGTADLAALAAMQNPGAAESLARSTVRDNRWETDVRITTTRGVYAADRRIAPAERFRAGGGGANAVRVQLTTTTPLYFGRLFIPSGHMSITRQATAAQTRAASFQIGSRLLSLRGGVANDDAADFVRLIPPFMKVEGDRVGQGLSFNLLARFRRQRRQCAKGAVHMQPEIEFIGEGAQRRNVVRGAGVHRSHRGDKAKGFAACVDVAADHLAAGVYIDGVIVVARDFAKRFCAEPRQFARFDDPVMGFGAAINSELRRAGKALLADVESGALTARDGERVEVRHGAARDEKS